MNLTHAPAEQLANARKIIKRLKGTGLGYVRLYTSWNSRTQKVRVKFYYVLDASTDPAAYKRHEVAQKLGFRAKRARITGHLSYVGEF